MFAGPIISREVLTAPRPLRFYVARASYAALLFILMWTAWQVLVGWSEVSELGMLARFGSVLYLLFSVLQLTVILFFAPLLAATAVSHEKDRRTFLLLLMTDLSDVEIVVGKLVSSLLQIFVILLAGVPVLGLCALLGGISFGQVANLFAVTAASGLAGGALGQLIALWRDRTFQSLSLTLLMVVMSIVGVEVIAHYYPTARLFGVPLVEVLNPYRAMLAVLYPASEHLGGFQRSSYAYIGVRTLFAASLMAFGTIMLRRWNPGSNEPREQREGDESAEVVETLVEVAEAPAELVTVGAGGGSQSAGRQSNGRARWERSAEGSTTAVPAAGSGPETSIGLHVPRRTHRRFTKRSGTYREPWADQPVLWREMRTRGYGAKPLIVKGFFLFLCALIIGLFHAYFNGRGLPDRAAWSILPVAVLSLLLVNAQGVTALTSERDSGALDLLLVTELSPKQFIYGKLYGTMYNTKEMVLAPLLMTIYYMIKGYISGETAIFIIIDFLVLCHFAAILGLHSAITYTNSRTAVSHSLGVTFFLVAGIFICAYLIIMSDKDFGRQLLSFMIFIGAGSVALYYSLAARNPSQAILLVSILTPFWTFYCVISLISGDTMAAFLFCGGVYGFTILSMLIPAVSDFDIALGRTNAIQG